MDYETAFKKPFTDIKKLLIGIALSILPIVNWLTIGYMLDTANRSMKRNSELPEWADWGNLFVRGLLATVIELLYFLPAIIVAAVLLWPLVSTLGPAMMQGRAPDMSQMFMTMGSLGYGVVIAGILGIITMYIAPSAMMHFASTGTFGSAFEFGSVLKKAFSGTYFVAWVVFVIYSMLLAGVLSFIPYVGGAAATFIAGITGFSLFGEVFAEERAMPKMAAPAKVSVKAKKRK
ncbi:MAG TPA: DUF4013 domain-containing protein [Nanoarchaeota archaeon]|nr:DUF4013 domain-containing protein [Nanoarchaeota archaeon]